jgi:hypothetical protein
MRRDTAKRREGYDAVVHEDLVPITGKERRRSYAASSRTADAKRRVTYPLTMRLIDGDRCRLGRSHRAAFRPRRHDQARETAHGERQGRREVGAEVDR